MPFLLLWFARNFEALEVATNCSVDKKFLLLVRSTYTRTTYCLAVALFQMQQRAKRFHLNARYGSHLML